MGNLISLHESSQGRPSQGKGQVPLPRPARRPALSSTIVQVHTATHIGAQVSLDVG